MAEGEDPFVFKDKGLDDALNKDDDKQEVNTTGTFEPYDASTPYNGREKIEMQTMQHEQSGLPDTSFEETPLLSGSIRDADIQRRLAALRQDPRTGIINTSQMMDTSINPLSEEDRAKQIERVKRLIKADYPNAKVDSLVIAFSKKRPMDIVVLGPKGGETKIVLNDGSGLQKDFLNKTFVKKVLGPAAPQIIDQQYIKINAQKKVLEEKNDDQRNEQQNLKSLDGEMKNIDERIDKKAAKVAQLEEVEGNEEEVKREKRVIINLKKDYKVMQKEREEVRKKLVKIAKDKQEEQQAISKEERKRNDLEE